jgi:triacylglycerol lipase
MLKKTLLVMAIALLIAPSGIFAGGSSDTCATRYPVVLAHGMAASAEILGIVDYWWGIKDSLEDEGADVYVTSVNGMDGTYAKAQSFNTQVLQILAVSNAPKVNIIGHSHGTLYSRYAISNLGLANKVASHTSIAGPHRGSAIADLLMDLPDSFVNLTAGTLDILYAFIFGDTDPDTYTNGIHLTRDYMAKAKISCPSVVLEPTWLILLGYEGDNDGLVSVNSAKWGNFRGVEDAAWYSPGCDHINIIGQFLGMTPGFSASDFYTGIVSDLKNRGY